MRHHETADERAFECAGLLAVVVSMTAIVGGWLVWHAQTWLHALVASLQ